MSSTPRKPRRPAAQRRPAGPLGPQRSRSAVITIGAKRRSTPTSASCSVCRARKLKNVDRAGMAPRNTCIRQLRVRKSSLFSPNRRRNRIKHQHHMHAVSAPNHDELARRGPTGTKIFRRGPQAGERKPAPQHQPIWPKALRLLGRTGMIWSQSRNLGNGTSVQLQPRMPLRKGPPQARPLQGLHPALPRKSTSGTVGLDAGPCSFSICFWSFLSRPLKACFSSCAILPSRSPLSRLATPFRFSMDVGLALVAVEKQRFRPSPEPCRRAMVLVTVGRANSRRLDSAPGVRLFERQRDHHLFLCPQVSRWASAARQGRCASTAGRGLASLFNVRSPPNSSTLQVPLPGATPCGIDASRTACRCLSRRCSLTSRTVHIAKPDISET